MKREISYLKRKHWIGNSYKYPIYKDRGLQDIYNKVARRVERRSIREISKLIDIEEYEIENIRTIINDYSYCDFCRYYGKDEWSLWYNSNKHNVSK